MPTTIRLKNFVIEVFSAKATLYAEVDEMPMMKSPIPTLLIVAAYFLFVKKVGPALMENRKAFVLKKTLVVYNALQVLLSAYLAVRYFRYVIRLSPVYSKCQMRDAETREEVLVCIWLYYVAKVTELMDTVFFVLRKKMNQVSFLHVYHHTLMMTGTWFFLKYGASDTVIFAGALNSTVHVVMYSYYGLSALGPHMAKYLTWKKYITTMQLVQFIMALVQFVLLITTNECPPSTFSASFIIINDLVFLILFSKFYYQNYVKSKGQNIVKNNNIISDNIKNLKNK